MKVLVLGAGMYVTGRGTTGHGTILPALAQSSRTLPIDEVIIAAGSRENDTLVTECRDALKARLGSSLSCSYSAIDTSDIEPELQKTASCKSV